MSGSVEKICVLVHRCHEQLLKLIHTKKPSDEFNGLGVSLQQGIILKLLLAVDRMTQKELTEKLQITSSSCGALIMKLEQEGYLERRISPNDKRTFDVYLTESGRALGETYKEKSVIAMDKWLSNLTEQEREQLFALLTKLCEGLEAQQESSFQGRSTTCVYSSQAARASSARR